MKVLSTFFVLGILLFTSNAFAQTELAEQYVVPPAYAGTPGNVTFLGPLYTGARTYQLLIHEDMLTGMVGKEIQALNWRIPTSATANWPATDITVTDYNISISGSVPPANRDLTNFASHVVGTQVLVKSGSLLILEGSYRFGSIPNDWGPDIVFDTNYLYEGGHLLIDIRLSGTGNSRSTDAIGTAVTGYGTMFSACWGSGMAANSGSQGNFSVVSLIADFPVPVELTFFTASVSTNNVVLNWITATEINNYGFEVERKSNNSNFETIGFVSGAGSTTETRNYSFTDGQVSNGNYTYRLKQIDFDGSFEYSFEVEADVNLPSVYSLEQNYPNPFNPITNINFSIAEAGFVKLTVYNLLGEEVKLLLNEFKEAGPQTITFDASSLTSGIYFYKLETPQFNQTRKMILAK